MKELKPNPLEQERIYPIFKATAPYMEIPESEGKGYYGVLLYDSWEDKVQCHICGKWFELLGHTHLQKHRITQSEYREKFGFNKKLPLCSKKLSKQHSELSQRNDVIKKFTQTCKKSPLNKLGYKQSKNFRSIIKTAKNKMSNLNRVNACPEQIKSRFKIVSEIVGKSPTSRDLNKYDISLMGLIRNRFGTLNNFRKNLGLECYKRGNPQTDAFLLATVRKFVINNKRIPKQREIKNYSTMWKHFGSWNKTLEYAGVHQMLEEIKGDK